MNACTALYSNLPLKMSSQINKVFSRSRSMVYKGFTKNLLVSNTLTCGLLLSGGDLIQQRIEKYMGYQQSHDLNRSGQHFSQLLKPVLNKKENQGKRPSTSLLEELQAQLDGAPLVFTNKYDVFQMHSLYSYSEVHRRFCYCFA